MLMDGTIPNEHQRDTLKTMRELAYHSEKVPTRYHVDRHSLSVEATVVASGALTDVRAGKLGGRAVAVRTPRVGPKTDNKSRKVRIASNWPFSRRRWVTWAM